MDLKIVFFSILVALVFTIICIFIGSKLHKLRGQFLNKKNEAAYRGKWVTISYWILVGERPRLCPILEGRVSRVIDNVACGIAILDISLIGEKLQEKLELEKQKKRIDDYGFAYVYFFVDLYDYEGFQFLQGPFKSSPFENAEHENEFNRLEKLASYQIPTIGIPSFDSKGKILPDEIKVFSKDELKNAFSDMAGFRRDLFILET